MPSRTPLESAALALAAVLLACIISISGNPSLAEAPEAKADDLWNAARTGDLDGVKRALEAGVPIDSIQRYGMTALNLASGGGHTEVVRLLLEKGADPNIRETFWGSTPLSKAVENTEIASLLIEAGAVHDIRDFYVATATRNTELVKAMLAARPLYRFEKEDALSMAAMMGPPELAKAIEEAEALDAVPAIEMSAAQLAEYAGSYGPANDVTNTPFHIHADSDGIELRGEGIESTRIVPLDVRHFRTHPDPKTGIFFLVRGGVIDGFLLQQRGMPPVQVRKRDDAVLSEIRSEPDAEAVAERETAPRRPDQPWSSFRGPNASGVADGQGAVADWDVESGHNIQWRAETPGLGLSSPVVTGGRVFLTTALSEGDQSIQTGAYGNPAAVDDETEHDWQVLAYSTATGELLWRTSIAQDVPTAKRHLKSSQANSTVATDGKRLAVAFPTGGLAVLDNATGKKLWHQPLGALPSGTADGVFEWGFASSPILHDGKVILQVDIHGGAYIAAWDLETGEPVWRTDRDEIPTWGTPNVIEHQGKAELVANGTTIRGYDPEDGSELWSLGPNSEVTIATPIGADGRIYVTGGYPPARPIYAIRLGQRGDLRLPEGKSSSEAIVWSHSKGGGYMSTPILYRGLFYMPHHRGRLEVYDANTGEKVFRSRFSKGGTLTGSPIAGDGLIYFATEEGLVYVIEAGRTYKELAVHDMGSGVLTTPALSAGRLFIRTLDHLWAIGAEPSAQSKNARMAEAEPTKPRSSSK